MSINFCTISNSSVDSFCGRRRSVVLNNLIATLRPPAVKGHKWPVPGLTGYEEQPKIIHTELERITVTATFANMTGMDSQEVKPQIELISISDLQFDTMQPVISISDIKFSIVED